MFFIINNQTVVYLTVVVLVFVGLFFKESIHLIEIQNKEWKKKHTATH